VIFIVKSVGAGLVHLVKYLYYGLHNRGSVPVRDSDFTARHYVLKNSGRNTAI